jgi:signal transduction histidine kinase
MIRSIFSRLLLSHIVVILLMTLTFGVFMSYLFRGHVVENKRRELFTEGNVVATLIAPIIDAGREPSHLDILSDLIGARIWVANKEGVILTGNAPPRWNKFLTDDPGKTDSLFAGTPQSWVRNSRNQPDPAIIVALPLATKTQPAALFLFTPIFGVNQTVLALDKLLIFSLIFGVLLATVLGFFIARGLTRPIANISKAAARFASGDYASRTTATTNDEIGKLGQVFNGMASSLGRIEQNRREFLANVSHELKTPVASIQLLAEALRDDVVKAEDKQRYLTTIVDETMRIDRLIKDLLDLSQLEAGELSINQEDVDIAAFIKAEMLKYSHLFASKNVSVDYDIPENIPPIKADRNRLSQVIANLVSNALRYSPEGANIEIGASFVNNKVSVAFTDHGPGIPLAEQPYVWDRFYRVDKSRARSGGGTGLGLAITKKLVLAMDGEIALKSEPGNGATFIFSLPAHKS